MLIITFDDEELFSRSFQLKSGSMPISISLLYTDSVEYPSVWMLLLTTCLLFGKGTDEPVADDMQRLEQQAQAAAAAPASKADIAAKLKEKVLFVR